MKTVKQLPTRDVSPEDMGKHIARFAALKPQSSYYRKDQGIPDAAYETVTAKTLYTLMAPSTKSGPMSATPAILTEDNLSVIIAECPPRRQADAARTLLHRRTLLLSERPLPDPLGR
jgi:hypothetical protein